MADSKPLGEQRDQEIRWSTFGAESRSERGLVCSAGILPPIAASWVHTPVHT